MIRVRMVVRVAARHVRELTRERRTLMLLFMMPVIVVIIFTVSRDELLEEIGQRADARFRVAVVGADNAPDLVATLQKGPFTLSAVPGSIRDALRNEKVQVALRIPKGFGADLRAGTRPVLTILSARRSFDAQFAETTLSEALDGYAESVVRRRLRAAGLPPELAQPLRIERGDVTSSQERTGSLLAQILPLMVIAQCVAMMSGTATDVTVGEKERRTVEALLATPLTRREIVAGKWLVVVGLGALSAAITLASGILAFRYASRSTLAAPGASLLPAGAYMRATLGIAAFILFIASLQMLIGFFARSQQQAGIMLSPIFFLAFMPLLFFQGSSGTSMGAPLYAIPLLGPTLLARNGLEGTAVAAAPVIAVVTHLAYAALVLLLADRVFRSERALLRTAG
jgi:sodium transport system permease protein